MLGRGRRRCRAGRGGRARPEAPDSRAHARSPPGERLDVDLISSGRQARQAVGYLPEGDMVVVNDAAHLVGRLNVPVVVASTRQTSQGLLVFAHLAEHESARPMPVGGSGAPER